MDDLLKAIEAGEVPRTVDLVEVEITTDPSEAPADAVLLELATYYDPRGCP